MDRASATNEEIWEMLKTIISKEPKIVECLKDASEDENTRHWTKPVYNLLLLIQQHESITEAFRKSGTRESDIRWWLKQSSSRNFIRWLNSKGYVVELFNTMGHQLWPWFTSYFTTKSLSDPETLKPFMVNPDLALYIAEHVKYLEIENEAIRQRIHYAEKVIKGSIGLDTLEAAVQIQNSGWANNQLTVTEWHKKLLEAKRTPVEELGFSIRTLNCLKRGQILSLADLAIASEDELLSIPNMGGKSITEIANKLADYGLVLRREDNETQNE